MNILVLAGSPKGEISVTMQYVKWLHQNMPEHTLTVVQVAQPIRRLEQDEAAFLDIVEQVRAADGILWAFPLYVAMPHAGLKRFVELISERGAQRAFQGKHCAILTTSIKFFDHTATEYMRGISEDLGMSVDETFSAHMSDLTCAGGTEQLAMFFRKWTEQIELGRKLERRTAPVTGTVSDYIPSVQSVRKRQMKVGIVTESGQNKNLDAMVAQMSEQFVEAEIFDLTSMKIAGNCTGCLRCGYENVCMYEGKDEVIETYRQLQKCDAILFCGFVVDRYFSARWKTFIDRRFFSTHMPILPHKPIGFVVAGPLAQLSNLRAIFEGVYSGLQMKIAGYVTDEGKDIDQAIAALADELETLARLKYQSPLEFPAVCGQHIFRDEVFAGLSGVFPADHRYYKQIGWYRTFPHRQIGARFGAFCMRTAMRIPAVRKNMQDNMKTNMLTSYRRVVK